MGQPGIPSVRRAVNTPGAWITFRFRVDHSRCNLAERGRFCAGPGLLWNPHFDTCFVLAKTPLVGVFRISGHNM